MVPFSIIFVGEFCVTIYNKPFHYPFWFYFLTLWYFLNTAWYCFDTTKERHFFGISK